MSKRGEFTLSIIGVFLLFGIPAALFAWVEPFLVAGLLPITPRIEWSLAQFSGFALAFGVEVGVCVATVIFLLRRVLPSKFRSRIVWLPPRMLDRTMLKKQSAELVTVVVICFGIIQFIHYGPPRFWRDFTGTTEPDVREKLGQAFHDSRRGLDEDSPEYTLAWRQGAGVAFFVTFREGVAVSQERRSR